MEDFRNLQRVVGCCLFDRDYELCETLITMRKKRRKLQNSSRITLIKFEVLSLFICYSIFILATTTTTSINCTFASTTNQTLQLNLTKISNSNQTKVNDNENQHRQQVQFKLECQPGEQRQFAYESSTKVWGTSNQQVRLRATLRLKCMEAPTNTTLKYLAEIIRLEPNFDVGGGGGNENDHSSPSISREQTAAFKLMRQKQLIYNNNKNVVARQHQLDEMRRLRGISMAADGGDVRAEPLLEEVGEAAIRMKRSVSGWFTKAWGSVKDFFVNIFHSSERSSVNREQVLRETGLDIAGQCKASSGKGGNKGRNPLPFDESVFEDLGPEYYVGASSVQTNAHNAAAAAAKNPLLYAYEFSGNDLSSSATIPTSGNSANNYGDDEDENDDDDETLSFFDDPKEAHQSNQVKTRRSTRSTTTQTNRKSKSTSVDSNNEDYGKLLKIPFVFIQSRGGKIIEIRFSGEESDLSVKNFKRHLCDLFATNLEAATNNNNNNNKTILQQQTSATTNEISPIGKHQTKYTLDSSSNSLETMKQSAIKAIANEFVPSKSSSGELERQNLVRVLALVGSGGGSKGDDGSKTKTTIVLKGDDDDDDQSDGGGDNVSAIELTNSTKSTTTTTKFTTIEQSNNENNNSNGRTQGSSQGDNSDDDDDENDDGDGDFGQTISVLRSINTTSQLQVNSKSLSPLTDIDRIQVQVKQVQQIGSGRLLGTAGQLSMSLVVVGQQQQQQQQQLTSSSARSFKRRSKRSDSSSSPLANLNSMELSMENSNSYATKEKLTEGKGVEGEEGQDNKQQQVSDIAELLQVSTSFSLQLVPVPRKSDGSIDDDYNYEEKGGEASKGDNESLVRDSTAKRVSKQSKSKRSTTGGSAGGLNHGIRKNNGKRELLQPLFKAAPGDAHELQKVLLAWRKQEARLQLSSSPLIAEQSSVWESEQLRLDTMRDQVRQRLNEEFVRNRIRRSLASSGVAASSSSSMLARQVAAKPHSKESRASSGGGNGDRRTSSASAQGDFGLGLTQLILGNGITTKRKGSIYLTLLEVLELESNLADDYSDQSMSRLMRETVKMDKLRQHCKSAVPPLDYFNTSSSSSSSSSLSNHIERKMPFGLPVSSEETARKDKQSQVATAAAEVVKRYEHKLGQCKQMLQLLLKMGERKGADLTLELIDECNARLQSVAKNEELGYGRMGKYYRHLRHQFVELLAHYERPTDSLIDKLIARLYYPKFLNNTNSVEQQQQQQNNVRRKSTQQQQSETNLPEFVYIKKSLINDQLSSSTTAKYNKTILKEEDDFNNRDGSAQLVMTLTQLAAKSSISKRKRVEVGEKLLNSLRSTTCSLFDSPDLDIIESMANFQQQFDEIIPRILTLARKCKQSSDQYLIACVHALSGQLSKSQAVQRFLADQLKSSNSSCLLKSEIVATLINAQLINDLKRYNYGLSSSFVKNDFDSSTATINSSSSSSSSNQQQQWPNFGLNQVDQVLLDILGIDNNANEYNSQSIDSNNNNNSENIIKVKKIQHQRQINNRRCLGSLTREYFSNKRSTIGKQLMASISVNTMLQDDYQVGVEKRKRTTREVVNEQNFWDEAQCKRWTIPTDFPTTTTTTILQASGIDLALNNNNSTQLNNNTNNYSDLLDEIDDNSIFNALINQQQQQQRVGKSGTRGQQRGQQRGQKMLLNIERESDLQSNVASTNQQQQQQQQVNNNTNLNVNQTTTATTIPLRKRHKCMAQKNFGPKNAQAMVSAEIVNDLVGPKDENKFLARFKLSTNFLGNKIDVGRMYLWHQRRTTRAHANILGKSIWDTSHNCKDKAPAQVLYMPLFDFNLWLVKVSVGLRLNAEMGFYSNCATESTTLEQSDRSRLQQAEGDQDNRPSSATSSDELQLFPTISLRASGEASAKLVVARAGMSLASQYSYEGNIRVSRQPNSCMSISSAHKPMNVTFSSWFQLWDNDCHYWASRLRAEPQAIKWKLAGRKASVWLEDECLSGGNTMVAKRQTSIISNVITNNNNSIEVTNNSSSISRINP